MNAHTIIKSRGALALGVFFTAITCRTVFDDVWQGAPVTVAHLNSLAAIVAAIASGHFIIPTFLQKRIPAALGLAAIFVGATSYVVTSSGARNAEVAGQKAAAIIKTNEERKALIGKLADAEADVENAKAERETGKAQALSDVRKAADEYDAAKRDAAKECASGKAKRCEGREATRDAAKAELDAAERRAADKRAALDKAVELSESHAGMMRGKIAYLGPETNPHEGYHQAARVFEAAGMGEAGVIEARLELLMPFGLVLITELGTIVFLGMALGHRWQAEPKEPATDAKPSATVGTPEDFAARKAAAVAQAEPSQLVELFAGEVPDRSANVIAFPPKILPDDTPKGSGGPKGGRKVSPEGVKAEIVRLISSGEKFASQEELRGRLNEMFGPDAVKSERLSVWLSELGPKVPRTVQGRRKMIG